MTYIIISMMGWGVCMNSVTRRRILFKCHWRNGRWLTCNNNHALSVSSIVVTWIGNAIFSVDCLRFMFTTNWPHFVCHITSIDVPSLFSYCNWTSVSDWYVVWFSFKVWYQKKKVFVRDLSTCSKYDGHSMFDIQRSWSLHKHENHHFDNEKYVFIWAPRFMRKIGYSLDLDSLTILNSFQNSC